MATNEPTVIAQPSTNTNKSNLNGMATSIGLNIIIPRDISIDAMADRVIDALVAREDVWEIEDAS